MNAKRWWTYQSERFPLAAHAPLVAAFSFSGVCYSMLLRGRESAPSAPALVTAFVTSILFFLQLRIADEFKDFDEDARFRPYRAVPRGLVRLTELGAIGAAAGAIQLALALWLGHGVVLLLIPVWIYLALMCREFFLRRWLKAHPFTYMWSHMLIMPLIDLYVTSCDWRASGASAPAGLIWFLAVSFFNGIVLEIGRKIRARQDEETGVETYTALWGPVRAVQAWLAALTLTALFAALAAGSIAFLPQATWLLVLLLAGAGAAAVSFLRGGTPRSARRFELFSGVWTLLMYLSLGAAPWAMRHYHLLPAIGRA